MIREFAVRLTCVGVLLCALAVPAEAKPGKGNGQSGQSSSGKSNKGNGGGSNGNNGHQNNGNSNAAQGNGNGHKSSAGDLAPFDALRNYIFGYRKTAGSGGGLPPGLAKKVARGGELPPGWQKKIYPGALFPTDLFGFASLLNPAKVPNFRNPGPNVDFYSIGNRLVKVNRPDNKILDIMDMN